MTPPDKTSGDDYLGLLDRLSDRLPRAAIALRKAAETRHDHLRDLLEGARLAGVNDLLHYLDRTAEYYDANEHLAKISFLVRRLIADFETALEATLSGYVGVATDAMRDVLEVEYLLFDFAIDPSHIDTWLAGSDFNKFLPRVLRERLRKAGVAEFSSSVMENADYKAHSATLHVSPREAVIGQKGRASDSLEMDVGFWEIFEHAKRVLLALEACGLTLAGPEWTEHATHPRPSLTRVADAHSRTQEMQSMYLAMLTGADLLKEQLGREPTTSELLRYVRDQLGSEG